MKKYLLLVTLVLGGLYANCQDLKSVMLYVNLRQFDKAKSELDNFMGNEKNAAKPDGWYYKAYIYNSIGREENKKVAESKAMYQIAFDALKKYAQLDPKAPLTAEEKNSTIFNIYYGNYDLGVKTYNEKNYAESFECFKKALEVHDYIHDKNIIGPSDLKFAAHDTDVVWNLVILGNELKKKEDVMIYNKRIADANLSDEKYSTAYDELVAKYKKEKNAELFTKYLTAAKKYYPVDLPYWESKEIEFALGDLEKEALLSKYEELTKSLPNNYFVFYNYGIEIDRFLTGSDVKGQALTDYRKKIEDLFKKAITIKSTIEANLQLANIYYSKTYELQDQADKIKGTKPAEVKVKNDLKALIKTTMSDCIPYAEEAVKQLGALKEYKFSDKNNYKLAVEILINAYKMNGNAAKVAEYNIKKAEVDKL